MNILNVWLGLPLNKRIMSALSTLAVILLMVFMTNIAMKPKMGLLFSGIEASSAGEVIAKLESLKVAYEVRGDAIYADVRRRDSLRLELATEGLPRQSIQGYELFDDMNSFAMSSDMFNTSLWRAKEGELARTLLAMPNIKAARVHLGVQKSKSFSSGNKASTASVTLTASNNLSPDQVKAIQYLTALAIVGLSPEDVAVIDTVRGLLAGPGLLGANVSNTSGADREGEIRERLMSMLEARVGAGNARVNVSLDIDRTAETISERTFDPNNRVLKSQTSNEITNSSTGTSGNVSVASNLPDGGGTGGENNSERTETNESVTWEVSETLRNREIAPGTVNRMTVAVLVSDVVKMGDDGEIVREPRSESEITILRDLISAASGFDESRGDMLTIRSLPFDKPAADEMIAAPTVMEQFVKDHLWSVIQSTLVAVVALVLGLFVVRPMMRQRPAEASALSAIDQLAPMALDGTLPAGAIEGTTSDALRISGPEGQTPEDLLKDKASEQIEDAADLLASWLESDAELAS